MLRGAIQILRILGSLGIFIFGMRLMSDGLQKAAGPRLKQVLAFMTTNLSSFNSNINARRAARVHTLFNLLGLVWVAILFKPFLHLIDLLVPGEVTGRIEITAHLTMFHSLFNIFNTLIFIGFVPQLERIVERLVRAKKSDDSEDYRFHHASSNYICNAPYGTAMGIGYQA
jgi:Na+/phosphate symporter